MDAASLVGGIGIGLVVGFSVGALLTRSVYGLRPGVGTSAKTATVDFYTGEPTTHIIEAPKWAANATTNGLPVKRVEDDFADSGPRVNY